MKLNRFVALAAIALLVVGAMGAISARTFAQTPTAAPAAQEICGPDTDNVQEGDQTGVDTPGEQEADCSKEAGGEEAGSKEADNEPDAAPAQTPAITAEAAQKIAEAHLNAGAATKVELDDENGQLVYSVEIGSTDVIVDANTGAVLHTEPTED